MKHGMIVWTFALILALGAGCDDTKNDENTTEDTAVAADIDVATATDTAEDTAALPTCPNEVLLTGLLPCQCYDTVATDPDAQVPGCITQVVCCPTVEGLRCEDHELLDVIDDVVEDTGVVDVTEELDTVDSEDVASETVEDLTTTPTCPNEVDLSTHTPCTCKGTLVKSVENAMPDCELTVVCCPFDGVKCE